MFDGKKLGNLNQSIDLILRRARNSSETDNPEAPKLDTDTLSGTLIGKIAILKELFKVIVISCNYIINFFNWQHQHSIITAVNHLMF